MMKTRSVGRVILYRNGSIKSIVKAGFINYRLQFYGTKKFRRKMQYDIPSNHHQEIRIPKPAALSWWCDRCVTVHGANKVCPKIKHKRRKVWHGSKWIRKARRYAIYARDGWRCVWCKCRVAIGAKAKAKHLALAQLDHVKPRALGGSNATENLVTSCNRCNKQRGATPAIVFAKRKGALTRLLEAIGKVLP